MSRLPVAVYEHAASVLCQVDEGTGMRTALYQHSMPDALRPAVLALVSEVVKRKEALGAALEAEGGHLVGATPDQRCLAVVATYELALRGGLIKGGAKSAVIRAVFDKKAALKARLAQPAATGGVAVVAPANGAPLPRYVRVNTLLSSVEAVLEHLERQPGLRPLPAPPEHGGGPLWRAGAVLRDPLLPSLLVLPPRTSLHGHPLVERGAVVLQDRASCLPAWALSPPPGARVVDACAAPGNKTTQLAAMVGPAGEVAAFERNAARYGTLRRQVARAGAAHVRCVHADFLAAAPEEYAGFTMALCDPSCSGSGGAGGHLASAAAEPAEAYAARLRSLAASQLAVVLRALDLPDMRAVVYSTCSVHREENEDVVAAVLAARAAAGWRLARALPRWPTRGLADAPGGIGPLCVRASADDATHGFFVARFERGGGGGGGGEPGAPQGKKRKKGSKPATTAARVGVATHAAPQPVAPSAAQTLSRPLPRKRKSTPAEAAPAPKTARVQEQARTREPPAAGEHKSVKRRRKDERRKQRKLAQRMVRPQ